MAVVCAYAADLEFARCLALLSSLECRDYSAHGVKEELRRDWWPSDGIEVKPYSRIVSGE